MPDERRMSTDRFYGGTSDRLRILRNFLEFVDATHPSREAAREWLFENAPGSSEGFARRNIDFLITAQILDDETDELRAGPAGKRYLRSRDPVDLYDGFTSGVKGFETILEALVDDPMTDEEIAECLRDAFPDYEIPVAVAQRHREWLQVLGFLYRTNGRSHITSQGQEVIGEAVSAGQPRSSDTSGRTYDTQSSQVAVSQEFRDLVFDQYNGQCLMTEIDHPTLLTLAHVLPRSDYVEYAEDPTNAFVLNWTHHMAFDAGLFTFDADLRLRVNPDFTPRDPWLRQTLLDCDGDEIQLPPNAEIASSHIKERNQLLDWWPL